jgi:hypothetical protein
MGWLHLPAALEYQKQVGLSIAAVGGGGKILGQEAARAIHQARGPLKIQTDSPAALLEHSGGSPRSTPIMRDKVGPRWRNCARLATRLSADAARSGAPTYREMLFVK